MSAKICGLVLIALLLLVTPTLTNVHAQEGSYLSEFSEPGEQPVVNSVWTYLTSAGTLDTIDVFQYGNVLVAFDASTSQPLSGGQATDFFTSFGLGLLTASGVLAKSSFSIVFQQSVVCEAAEPQIGDQLQGLAEDQASTAVEKVLPDGAASVAKVLFRLGDEIGLVKDSDPGVLTLGVACYGGDLLESYAATQLYSCQQYVANLQQHLAYEGMGHDLATCISDSVSKLQEAEYSPDVLAQYGETVVLNAGSSVVNTVEGGFCYLARCQSVPAHLSNATLDQIIGEVSSLSSISPSLQNAQTSAQSDSQAMTVRLAAKSNEAQTAISGLSSALENADAAISHHSGSAQIFSAFWSPPLDLSLAITERDNASSTLVIAQSYLNSYRYNSAVDAANQGMQQASYAIGDVHAQEGISRGPSILAYGVVAVIAILCFGLIVRLRSTTTRRTKSTSRNY